jgi:hypothetical protein
MRFLGNDQRAIDGPDGVKRRKRLPTPQRSSAHQPIVTVDLKPMNTNGLIASDPAPRREISDAGRRPLQGVMGQHCTPARGGVSRSEANQRLPGQS